MKDQAEADSESTAPAQELQEPGTTRGYLKRTFQAFQYRDFRILWSGAFTSTTGNWMQIVAQSWVVLEITGEAYYLGLVSFLGQLPIILLTLVGGAFADRVDRRKLLLFSQFVQMTVAFSLTLLLALDRIDIWHFLVLAFASGIGQAFGGPAYQALIPGLVPREHVANAIALNSIQFNLARVVGPVIAGAAFASLGAVFCFGLNGLSFLAVIVALFLVRSSFIPRKTEMSVLVQIKEGLQYVKDQGALWQLTVLGFASTFCGVPLITLLPVFARDIFQLEATGYSILMAISGMGSITGALLYATFSSVKNKGLLTLWVQVVFSVLLCLFALSRVLLLSSVMLFFSGLCLIGLFASITSLVQLATAEEVRGRVMSIFMLAFRAGMPLGDISAAYVASRVSPTAAVMALGLILATVSGAFLMSKSGVKKL